MRDSPDFLPSASPAERWFFMGAGKIEQHKERFLRAREVMNTTVMIECRDRIRKICAKGASLLSPGPMMERLPFREAPPLEDVDKEETSEGNILRSIHAVIVSARSWLKENFPRAWLKNDLPPEFLDGFGDSPGGSRTPVPSRPLPGGLRVSTARQAKTPKPVRSPIFLKKAYI